MAFGVLLLGVAAIVLPAVAGSETTPTIEAVNVGGGIYGEEHHWSPSQATIAAGGSVTLSNPTEVDHGVYWVAGPSTPSCSGVPVGTAPADSATKWSGSCTFTTPGVYTFYCTVHGPAMTGRVTVSATGTTTTTTTSNPPASGPGGSPLGSTPSPPETGDGTALGSPALPGSPRLGAPAKAVAFSSAQHGGGVRGTLEISAAGARGRLEVDLLVARHSLAGAGHAGSVRIGRLMRSSLPSGTLSFTITLTGKAREALERTGRLLVTVRLLLTPVSGPAVTVVRRLTLRHR